ncbi:hypothetical protein JT358_12675 [Micrococcales bacterium 31B]|nr:hypothetical protein [Micrococcales bacterium 31B]
MAKSASGSTVRTGIVNVYQQTATVNLVESPREIFSRIDNGSLVPSTCSSSLG